MKTIKVTFCATLNVPSNAEVIRLTDDDGVTQDYIRVAGKLVHPDIHWMEYFSENNPPKDIPRSTDPDLNGLTFSQVDFEFEETFLNREEWPGSWVFAQTETP